MSPSVQLLLSKGIFINAHQAKRAPILQSPQFKQPQHICQQAPIVQAQPQVQNQIAPRPPPKSLYLSLSRLE